MNGSVEFELVVSRFQILTNECLHHTTGDINNLQRHCALYPNVNIKLDRGGRIEWVGIILV